MSNASKRSLIAFVAANILAIVDFVMRGDGWAAFTTWWGANLVFGVYAERRNRLEREGSLK